MCKETIISHYSISESSQADHVPQVTAVSNGIPPARQAPQTAPPVSAASPRLASVAQMTISVSPMGMKHSAQLPTAEAAFFPTVFRTQKKDADSSSASFR